MGLRRKVDTLTPLSKEWAKGSPETRKRLRGIFRNVAKMLAGEASKRAPRKEGDLEKSPAVKTTETGTGLRAEIYVREERLRTKRPGAFLDFIHDGKYRLGLQSALKDASQKEEVGPRFMDRALEDHEDEILKEIEDAFFGSVAGE